MPNQTDSKRRLPVTELHPERPYEFLPPEQRPRPQDRKPTYFVEVED